MQADVIVIGSLNMDLVITTQRAPEAGETLSGTDFHTIPGGKGANQAVAAAKLGCTVALIGRVGSDAFGEKLLETLSKSGVNISNISRDAEASTGIAIITVEADGQNRILLVPGANGKITPFDVDVIENLIAGAKLLIMQMEIPLNSVHQALDLANFHHVPVLLNLSPARCLSDDMFQKVKYLVVNETEASSLTGLSVVDIRTAESAAGLLLEKGTNTVIITLGDQGAVCASGEGSFTSPAYLVKSVDSTAAGDAFIGGYASAVLEGKHEWECIQYANAVGALTTTKLGAQISLPTKVELLEFLENAHIRQE